MRKLNKILLVIFLAVIFVACSPSTPPPVEQSHSTTQITQKPTNTIRITNTYTPTFFTTSTPGKTATPTIALTNTPTLIPGLSEIELYSAWNRGNQTVFSFILPGIDIPLFGKVDDYLMQCEPSDQYNGDLLCVTDNYIFGVEKSYFEFFVDEAMQIIVYEGEFTTGLVEKKPTPPMMGLIWPKAVFTDADILFAGAETWCPLRGQNISCETEYRNYEGVCLVGHTCYDACGWYYSVDTIKSRQGPYTFSEPCLP